MARRRNTSVGLLQQAFLSWRFAEDWHQEILTGSGWFCANAECAVRAVDVEGSPGETAEGHFRCPECADLLSYRCGNFHLPVGEVVPPDVCRTRCRFFSCCIRYRLHESWLADPAIVRPWNPVEIDFEPGAEVFHAIDSWADETIGPGAVASGDG